jgi:hypothetical protein
MLILGTFIYDNYRQALTRIREDGQRLSILSAQLKTNAKDYEGYLISEREYLRDRKMEPAEVARTVDYMECLSRLKVAR